MHFDIYFDRVNVSPYPLAGHRPRIKMRRIPPKIASFTLQYRLQFLPASRKIAASAALAAFGKF
jgi:hypothetical protein